MSQRTTSPHMLKLRWKFFIALAFFALTPVMLVSFAIRSGTEDVKQSLSGELRALLREQVQQDLIVLAENHARMIRHDNLLRKTVITGISVAVKNHLQQKSPDKSYPYPLFGADFSISDRVPANLLPRKEYMPKALQEHGLMSTSSGHVSFSDLAFYHSADAKNGNALARQQLAEAKRLMAVQSLLQRTVGDPEQQIYRAQIVLEDGLYMTFPGHGEYPAGKYNPKKSLWYQRAIESHGPVWTSPLWDVVTGLPIASYSRAIRDDSGKTIGVVGLEVLFEREFLQNFFGHSWGRQATTMFVLPKRKEATGKLGLEIVARASAEDGGVWHIGEEEHWVTFDSPVAEEVVLEALGASDVGTTVVPWQGVPSYWAWAPYTDGGWFVTILPVSSVMSLPNMVRAFQDAASEEQSRIALFSILGVILVSMIIAIFASRMITRPMKGMISAAERLASGDFSARISFRTGDERDRVIDAFNTMGPKLADHLETQKTLAVAQEVQANFLPSKAPQLTGWDISGASRYCEETGGDYYDFHDVCCDEGRRLGILVGDVSGHGIPSALLMTTARALLRGLAQNAALSKAERITHANALLAEDTFGTGRFMTLFALEAESGSGEVRWVRAGHDPALCYCPRTDSFTELGGRGLPLGGLPDSQYEEQSFVVADGMIIFIGTDGVWEAEEATSLKRDGLKGQHALSESGHDDFSSELQDIAGESRSLCPASSCRGEMYGKERLCDCIRRHSYKSAEEIRDAIIAEVEAWQGGKSGDDDITLVIMKKVAEI